ncbi:hypothetical protein D9M69_496800 [compost metagenome]
MQAQRHVGVFGGVLGGARQVDLVEADLARALAADFFVGDGLQAEQPLGQAVHAVVAVRGQHVALQHGVVRHAAQRYAVVGEDVDVVFQVLAELGAAGVFEPGAHALQHEFTRELPVLGQPGHVRAAVRHGDIAGFARRRRQRDADQLRLHRVERIGLGIDRHQRRGLDAPHPVFQHALGGDRLVADLGRRALFCWLDHIVS